MMKNFTFKSAKSAIAAAVAVCLSLVNARTAFGQVEFLSVDDARQSIKTEITSLDKDKIVDEKLRHITDENSENCGNINKWLEVRTNIPVGLKVIVTKDLCLMCVDKENGTIGMKTMERGTYTITSKILFYDQWNNYYKEYLSNMRYSDTPVLFYSDWDMKHGDKGLPGNIFVRSFFDFCSSEIDQTKDDFLLNGNKSNVDFVTIFSDDKGNDYYYGCGFYSFLRSSSSGLDHDKYRGYLLDGESVISPTSELKSKIIPLSYYEKMEKALVNKEHHIYASNPSLEFFKDALSGEVVPVPKKEQVFKCEKIALVGDACELIGIFTNGSDRFALSLGDIKEAIFDNIGKDTDYGKAGFSYQYTTAKISDSEVPAIVGYDFERGGHYNYEWKMSGYPFFTDGSIGVGYYPLKVVPVEWETEQNRIVAKIKSDREQKKQDTAKRFAELVKTRQQEILKKYGDEAGTAINNGQVKIGMTQEMARASWGYPMNTYSLIRSNVKVDIWVYANATLSFVNGKLTQIEKMR